MKKITKFLDSVMGGIKRTCVAKALAVFAVASIAINANALADNNQADDDLNGITSVDQLVGISQADLEKKQIEVAQGKENDLTFPTDFAQHFFLYNVNTGRFLNVGGYWGTHVSLKEYGEPLAIVKGNHTLSGKTFFKLVMEMDGTESKYVGWYGTPGDKNKDAADIGVFVDRWFADVFGWQLEPVPNDTKNTYRLYTFVKSDGSNWDTTKRYYLCSNKGSVDVDVNCGAFPYNEKNENPDYAGYDEWRFLSYEQIRKLQDKRADNMKDALELSFKLRCPGFSRGDNDIKKWNTYNFKTKIGTATGLTDDFAKYGLSKYYNYIAGDKTETDENVWTNTLPAVTGYEFEGTKYKHRDDYRRHLGKYYTASITNKRGIVYQDVDISIPGRYQIECKGYSTTKKASLFAGVLNSDNTLIDKAKKTTLNQVSNMSQDAQNALHVSEKNVDYAGKNFYGSRQYINTVYVTVTKKDIDSGKNKIRFGIMVGDQNDANVEGDEWTVFDDFRILYAAKDVKEDLILDEYRDNLSYLVNCKNPMENKTLHLNKTFTLNKWNSFILPVNLNKTQVLATFGANARLAKLTRLTDTGIEFTSVDLLDDDSKPAIEAYVPYIIFPRKGADQTEAYTASYEQQDNQPLQTITIAANHYVIGKVSMPLTTTEGVKANDWSKMDKEKWTTTMIGGNDQIKAYGTFARTFGTEASQDEKGKWTFSNKNIFEDRDNLIGSYFFDNGNMYHSNKSPRGLRGFSCWFRTDGAQKSLKFTLDGVTQSGTTGIEDILADYEQPVSRFANGVYNMNGQLVKQGNSTAGLPSGMYIVNGKKCIVR